ncbi:NADH-quinone oxidoreductase subunit N [Geomobilimonas luticola]|uniref:NADH-quinone oxidoreductase subunit N n=1 Tax=Geomobilimonas luticola TaxID=1114878 RepID=A0ABS5S899_9BACT|nr:NADH-quinone oxidoreductase subunit N [Geomobilimonas luticola]MBT0651607.1 NADH-quinone oxidoreductase subunit N [Geomobilimonas luticola]
MTVADLWTIMPLLLIACGSVLVLLLGAVVPGRYLTGVAVATCLGAALWALQVPAVAALPQLGVALTPLARLFTVVFALAASVTLLLSHDFNERRGIRGEEYPATILFALFGMSVLAAASTLLTLFLGLEALTFAFYILVAMDKGSDRGAEAGLKYLLLGAISAAFIAFGIALIYAATGTLEIVPAMAGAARGIAGVPLALAGWGLILAGAAFKMSLVPAHLWTPDVYQGGPPPVVAFLSTGSKGAAVLFLITLLRPAGLIPALHGPLWWLALLSMTVGNLAALRQQSIKRLLAYSSIAQMGYVTLALLTGSREGYGAAAFYVVLYTAMNLVAFGAVASLSGRDDLETIEEYRGLGYGRPFTAGVLALALFALAGIPPTGGFMGKFFIFAAALRGGEPLLAVLGILTAVVSVYFYLRVVVNLYLHSVTAEITANRPTSVEIVPLVVASLVIMLLGIYPGPLMAIIEAALF